MQICSKAIEQELMEAAWPTLCFVQPIYSSACPELALAPENISMA